MESTKVSEEQLERMLAAAHPHQRREGLVLMEQQYRHPVAAMLRKQFPHLSSDDLADAWSETIKEMVQKVMHDRTFHPQPSLVGLLCTIARNWVISQYRRTATRKQALEKVLGPIAQALQASQVGDRWRKLDPIERKECLAKIRAAVDALPARQRQVMQVFVDLFPETESMEFLRGEVARRTGQVETLAAVKRALQEARSKVRRVLRAAGYEVGTGGDA